MLLFVVAATLALPAAPAHAEACQATLTPDVNDVTYKTLPNGSDVRVDVFLPQTGTPPYPGLVMVHGGVWKSGCKEGSDLEADVARNDGFAVFVIDFRLSCKPSNPPPGTDPGICGFHAIDPVIDVGDAIQWVRDNAATYETDPGNVGVLGFSSGGNLAYMSGTLDALSPGGTRADAVASWSGTTELGVLADRTTLSCSLSVEPEGCTSARAKYVGCSFSTCPAAWDNASPWWHLDEGDAPLFMANSTNERVALREATDLYDRAVAANIPATLCTVRGSKHAKTYKDHRCRENDILTVFEYTLSWLRGQLS